MYNLTNQNTEGFNVSINLREELNSLTSEFSLRILYVRNCKFVKCDCYEIYNKAGKPDCPKCFGSGYFASIESMKAIVSQLGGYSGGDKVKQTPVGMAGQKEEVYYFDYKSLPKEKDLILKTTWKNDIPVDVISVFEVVNVHEMRGDNGRVELFGANVQLRPDLTVSFNKTLKLLPRKALSILSKGGKYVWPYKLISQKNEVL